MNESCGAFVMVVDDDSDLREAIMEMLQDNAYSVVGAANGKEALDFLRRATSLPCVILLDLMMPIMDGKTFRAELMRNPELSEIPVVVLSAHANMDDVLAGFAVSAKLRKPVQMGSLMALVDRHCKDVAARAEA
jgi:CheY-like chemotaxis protein